MMKKRNRFAFQFFLYSLMILLYILHQESNAQSDSVMRHHFTEEIWSDQLEELAGDATDIDLSELIEMDVFFTREKFNINCLSPEVASQILQLTDKQYYQLQLYIEEYGELLSLYELLAIESFSEEDLQRILSFITIDKIPKKNSFRAIFYRPKQEFLFRYEQVLENKVGYDTTRTTHYLGSPQKFVFRYKYGTRHLSFAISGEKDPGEQFFRGAQKTGFDHYSFHITLKDLGILKTLVLGNYRVNLGQGLVAGSGLIGSKGGQVKAIRKFSTAIQPVAPMSEGNYLHGIGTVLGTNRYSGVFFYGHRRYDGDVWEEEGNRFFESSLNINGFHRTTREIEKKNALTQYLYGTNFKYKGALWQAGIQALYSHFSAIITENDAAYKLFDFTGERYYIVGIDYQTLIKKNILFGEIALSNHQALALLQGFILQPDPQMNIGIMFRYYHPKYISLTANAFGERSHVRNETGLYLVSDIILGRKTTLSLYSDFYLFPWLQYRIDKPTLGLELSGKLRRDIVRNAKMEIRYQYKKREVNSSINPYIKEITPLHRHKCRGVIFYSPLPNIVLKTQIDFIFNQIDDVLSRKKGILIFQDINLSFPKVNIETKCRIAFFDTDSYEERLYAYENDLYYSFNITGYYYQGWRGYFMIKYRIRFIDLSLRMSHTYYIDRKEIGSGLELIKKPHKTDIKAQILIRIPTMARKTKKSMHNKNVK